MQKALSNSVSIRCSPLWCFQSRQAASGFHIPLLGKCHAIIVIGVSVHKIARLQIHEGEISHFASPLEIQGTADGIRP
jgi:hypothetical protein